MKNENVSINIRPVVNGWIANADSSLENVQGAEHVFTTPESLGAFVAQFYRPLVDERTDTSNGAGLYSATICYPEHNPDNLTPEQVGVKDGWRLLLKSEIHDKREFSCEAIQQWNCSRWMDFGYFANSPHSTYRTKLPFGQI